MIVETEIGESLRVALPSFEGPLDLLLYLVRKEEVDIYDIPIAKITEQYLQYLTMMEQMDLAVAGDFLVMAANLIYIKSRTLLPTQDRPPEEAEEDDPRWDLIRQLIEYKKFKEAAGYLQKREEVQADVHYRTLPPLFVTDAPPETASVAQVLGKTTMLDLVKAFQKVLNRLQEAQKVTEIKEEIFTVADKIDFILSRLEKESQMLFSLLFAELASRNEIVVTFLALLELIRLKQVTVRQNTHFDDIEIHHVI